MASGLHSLLEGDQEIIDPFVDRSGKEFEGAWAGTLNVSGVEKHLVVKLTNEGDGLAVGTLINLDGAGIQLPLRIAQKGTALTLEVRITSATYTGALSSDGSSLVGTWVQGPLRLPLILKRPPK